MKWTVVSVLLIVIGLWLLIGFLPQRLYTSLSDAAAFGDSFGCVNSLFASLAFAFVAMALILQIREVRDNARTQAEQGRVQLEQIRIAERTTRIQEAMRLDARRRLVMDAFLKINRDTVTFKHAFLAWHPENNRRTHSQLVDQETERRLKKDYFDAYTALRSNCVSIGLIFDTQGDTLGKAIQDLYDTASRAIQFGVGSCPPAAECEAKMNEYIQRIEREIEPLWESLSDEPARHIP